ncbi:MAG: pseudouridine synthase [Nitrospira sp.]|nr:rRNA pseudouridine synthase [Candidatus Manganitrophaceae bacterium]HIL35572.1 rRNA pseudouridine synthase [Candidatus Manganitrophaceae bacterium]
MMERLQKVLARAGIASRRHSEVFIEEGRVRVNGTTVTSLGTKVDPEKDHIKVDGKRITIESKKVYLVLNKPIGCITSLSDPEGRPTVMDLIPAMKERIYPVGRLDYDTEGLLLLTNDGALACALMHPGSRIEKIYKVKVKGRLTDEGRRRLEQGGMSIAGEKTAPCQVRTLRETAQNNWIEIILHEGKKRQIRMMMKKVGHPVIRLKRVGYAFLKIGDLAPGKYRHLHTEEIGLLKKWTKEVIG